MCGLGVCSNDNFFYEIEVQYCCAGVTHIDTAVRVHRLRSRLETQIVPIDKAACWNRYDESVRKGRIKPRSPNGRIRADRHHDMRHET